MKLAPAQWKGSAQKLIDDVLRPSFLPKESVVAWQNFLVRKLEETEPTFIVASATPELRSRWGQEKIHLTKDDSKVIFGDASDASAIYTYLLETRPESSEKMAALYLHLPHHMFDLDKFTRWATLTNNMTSAGWKIAHVVNEFTADARWESLGKSALSRMTLLKLHPFNFFIFPNLNKSGAVFADDPRFHALIKEAYRKYYGDAYAAYLELMGLPTETAVAEDFEIDFSATPQMPVDVKVTSKELISKIEPTDAFDLKLVTVNESQGYHSRVLDPNLLSRGFFDIKLEYKDKAGTVQTVGFYRLNLKDLYDKKFLNRDDKGLKLMIYRAADNGHFSVGPRKNGPMAPIPTESASN